MKLLPAVKKGKKIFVGKVDENHQYIKETHGLEDGIDREHGFVPDGNHRMWLSRISALSWLRKFEPDVYAKIVKKVPPEGLHSHIYAAAKGIVQKLTKAEKENGYDVQPGEARREAKETEVTEANLKDMTLVMIDHGISIHLAEKLAESYGTVKLFIPNVEAYPSPARDEIGTGLEGVERIYDFDRLLCEKPDKEKTVFFFPDIGFSGEQARLKADGYLVCGAGDSDKLELDKWFFQQEIARVGLPTAKTERLVGITALRDYLKDKKMGECFIKISFHRGLMETYKWKGKFISSSWLKDLEARLGNHAESQVFLVQHKIDSIAEIGMDSMNLNGELPENSLCGLEIKDAGYLCRVMKEQPKVIKEVNDKLRPIFEKLGCAGQYSNEVRVTEGGEPYVIDLTTRMPSPPGELLPEMYEKHCYAQAIYSLACGKLPILKPKHKYGSEIIITSTWLDSNHWLPVEFPEEAKKYVRLKNYCIKEGKYYVIPNGNGGFIGGVIGYGETADEACTMALKYADMVQGEEVIYESGVLSRAQKEIAKLKAIGITF